MACLIFYLSLKTIEKIYWLWPLLLILLACQKNKLEAYNDPWADYRKAYAFLNTNKDSAFLYFNRIAENSKEKDQVALSYYNMALIQSDAGDYFGAQESLTLSLSALDEHRREDRNYLATDYNLLSIACLALNDNQAALSYSQSALSFSDDPALRPYILNNQGNALRKLKNYSQAIHVYEQVLQLTQKNSAGYARALTNMAATKWSRDPRYNAVPEFFRALGIRLQQKDVRGESASYAHLSDLYKSNQPDSAKFYADKMYALARKIRSPDDELQALQKLILTASAERVKSYYVRYQNLSDSLATVRNAAKNQFALIRYGVEKNKADNLKLQKENTERKYQLGLALTLALGVIIVTSFAYRKRRQRLQLKADNRIRQDRLRLSQRVHDTIANGIYRVMNELDYSEKIDKNYMLGQLDMMYEQSRKISHDQDEAETEGYSEQINQLLHAFKQSDIKLALSGNDPALWQQVNSSIKSELKLMLQELMVNMSKHSKATQALIDFEISHHELHVSYRDNGVGFSAGMRKGKGLRNTENRITALSGKLIFETNSNPGASLKISIPLS